MKSESSSMSDSTSHENGESSQHYQTKKVHLNTLICFTTLACLWPAVTLLYNPVGCVLQRIRLPVWHLSIAPCLTPGWPQAVLTVGSVGSCRLWRSTTRWGLAATQPQALWGERRGRMGCVRQLKRVYTTIYTTITTYECVNVHSARVTHFQEVHPMWRAEVFQLHRCCLALHQSAFMWGNDFHDYFFWYMYTMASEVPTFT